MAEYAVVLGLIVIVTVATFTILSGAAAQAIDGFTSLARRYLRYAARCGAPEPQGGAASHTHGVAAMTAAKHVNPRSERGQTMVEFALAMPVLCLVLFGIIQFGVLFNDYLSLTDATRVGARKGAVSRTAVEPSWGHRDGRPQRRIRPEPRQSRRRRDRDGVDSRRRAHGRGDLPV